MNTLTTFAVILLAGLACSNPISKESDVLRITDELFLKEFVVYTAENDIVKLFTPLNALNFDDDDDDDEGGMHIFFVEEKTDSNGDKVRTVSVLINGEATKLLDNGNDFAAASDDSKQVFIGADDGIYLYNDEKKTAEKYGSITEKVIGIAKENGTDTVYILTDNHEVYKVTDDGNVKEKVDKIKDARQIVLDFQNNLYYVDGDKHVHVYSDGNVKKVKGLPSNPSYIQLLRPPFVLEDAIPVVIGKKAFHVYVNGTSEFAEVTFDIHPSAYSMEATLIQYYAHNKKIYEFNILAIIMGSLLDELKTFFDDKTDQIQSIATRSRKDFGA